MSSDPTCNRSTLVLRLYASLQRSGDDIGAGRGRRCNHERHQGTIFQGTKWRWRFDHVVPRSGATPGRLRPGFAPCTHRAFKTCVLFFPNRDRSRSTIETCHFRFRHFRIPARGVGGQFRLTVNEINALSCRFGNTSGSPYGFT